MIIGLAVVLFAYRQAITRVSAKKFIEYLLTLHAGVTAFILFCFGLSIFIFPVALAYIFESPVKYLVYLYLALILLSVFTIYGYKIALSGYFMNRLSSLSSRQKLFGILVLSLLIFEFCVALSVGGGLNDDVPVHLSKIQLYLNSHISLSDPFTGYNGIIDLRYSTNLLNALQTIPAYLLGLPAYKVWYYSHAFYNLVIIASLFALAKTFLPKNSPKAWPYILIILIPIYGGSYFFDYAELPHSITLAWFSLLLIGLKLLLEKNSWALLLISSALIATTHALSAFTALAFLSILLAILLISRKVSRQQILAIVISFFILSIPVLANISQPARSTKPAATLTSDRGLHARELNITDFGPLKVPKVQFRAHDYYLSTSIIDVPAIIVYFVLAGYVILLKRVKNTKVKVVLSWLIILAGIEVFNTLYAATAGYIYLIYKTKNSKSKILITTAVLFFFLIAYNPIFLTIFVGHLPLWLIARLQDFNTFAFLAPILGILVVYRLIVRYWGIAYLESGYSIVVIMLLVSLLSFHKFPIHNNLILNTDRRNRNTNDYKQLKGLKPLDKYVKDKIIFTSDPYVAYRMVIATDGYKMGMLYNAQANQAQNIDLRDACNDALLVSLEYQDLNAAKIDTVVLKSGKLAEEAVRGLPKLADSKQYLRFEKQIGDDRIYSVLKTDIKKLSKSKYCNIPYGQ